MFTESQKYEIISLINICVGFEKAKEKFCDIDCKDLDFWADSVIFWGKGLIMAQVNTGVEYWSESRINEWIQIAKKEIA